MFELIKMFLSLFEKKEVTAPPMQYPLGVHNETQIQDVRDIQLAEVFAPLDTPLEYMTDTSMLPKMYQGQLGTCVAHAFAFAKMYLDYLETKKVPLYSRRFIYVVARRFSDMTESLGQGLFPRQAAKVLNVVGTTLDSGFDNNSLSHDKYVSDFIITKEMIAEANQYRTKTHGFPDNTAFGLKQAILRAKVVPATILIDWERIDRDGTVHAPKKVVGSHEIVFVGWEIHEGKERFVFQNWWKNWGTSGRGYINADEIEKVVNDSVAFVDIPNDIIERAKNIQYIFLSELKKGSRGTAVKELQKRLIEYGLLTGNADGIFGSMTNNAVIEYQELKGLMTTGQVDAETRNALNSDVSKNTKKSKMDLWCEAIAKVENANPSWNNPGNIRYIGQVSAVSKSKNGFCIFPDMATGYMELRKLLTRACTGQSKNYLPTMTLFEFYAGTYDKNGKKVLPGYAPKEDKNNPDAYSKFVAQYIGGGVTQKTLIKELL